MIAYIVRLAGNLVFVTTQISAVSRHLDSVVNDGWKYDNTSIDFWRGERKVLTKSPLEFYKYARNMKEMAESIADMRAGSRGM